MLLILLMLILVTPIRLRIDLVYRQGLSGRVTVALWGVPQSISFRVKDGQLLLPGQKPRPMRAKPGQGRRMLMAVGTFLRTDKARRLFWDNVNLEELSAAFRFSMQDAARTALLTGSMRTLYALIPRKARKKIRISAIPDFFSQGMQWQGRCIIFSHMGILLITAAMLLFAWRGEKKEHGKAREAEI